jgi:hypothetical protein
MAMRVIAVAGKAPRQCFFFELQPHEVGPMLSCGSAAVLERDGGARRLLQVR